MEVPLTAAAMLFLFAFAIPILVPDLPQPWLSLAVQLTWATWLAFVVDYLVRLVLAERRGHFLRSTVLDALVVALPLLRPLRLLRVLTLLQVLNRHAGASLRGRVAVYVGGATTLIVFVASLAVLDAERGADDANITTFPDALWWALTTITTVGYGDQFPVTPTGRFVAVGLMLAGIALLGVVTASLASWLIERVAEVEEDAQAATRRDIAALTAEVAALRDELRRDARQASS